MIDTYALLLNQVMACLGGFLIGVGLKTIIDGFAARDVVDSRLDDIDSRLEEFNEDISWFEERLTSIEDAGSLGCTCDPPSKAEVDAAIEMLRPPGELPVGVDRPPFGEYHKFIRPLEHPIASIVTDTVRDFYIHANNKTIKPTVTTFGDDFHELSDH